MAVSEAVREIRREQRRDDDDERDGKMHKDARDMTDDLT